MATNGGGSFAKRLPLTRNALLSIESAIIGSVTVNDNLSVKKNSAFRRFKEESRTKIT